MMLLITACCLLLIAVGIRLYVARTNHWLNVHLNKINALQPYVDDAIEIVFDRAAIISRDKVIAGFALSESRWECNEASRWILAAKVTDKGQDGHVSRFKGDFYAWLILRESRKRYLIAVKYARPETLTKGASKQLSKLRQSDDFHSTQADEFIERMHRKQRRL